MMSGRVCRLLLALLISGSPLLGQEQLTDRVPEADVAALTDTAAAALDAHAARIANQLRCPVCTGQSVL